MLTLNFDPATQHPLTWVKETRTLVAEASDLQLDRIPRQLAVHSVRTGVTRMFNQTQVRIDREGDVESWDFVAGDVRLSIFND